MENKRYFWQYKTLEELTLEEWESLCDRCGLCCMHKVEDEDTGTIYTTNIACQMLDCETACCKNYYNRQSLVPDCIHLDLSMVKTVKWLPKSCAYRRLHEGRGLAWWHPLVSKNTTSVHTAGVSIKGKDVIHENMLQDDVDYSEYILEPLELA